VASDAVGAFVAFATAAVDGLLERQPEWATAVGDHRHDHRLTIGTAGHYTETSRWASAQLAALSAVGGASLPPQHRVDAEILANQLALLRFAADELREHEWNPMVANPGRAIYELLARDFAPLADRVRSAAGRLVDMPASLAAARQTLGPMPLIHIETALSQFAGTRQLITGEFRRLAAKAGVQRDLPGVAEAALDAIMVHTQWLQARAGGDAPGGFRDPRLGAALYCRTLGLALDTALPADGILARAEADLAKASEDLAAAAAEITGSGPGGLQAVPQVLGALAADAPDDATILALVRAALARQREFVAGHELVTVFTDPLEVIVMPEIDRGVGVAYCDAPGPLEPAPLPTFIAVSPTPAGWAPDRVRSFYREYNRHMVHSLMIHEAMPGHAVQLQHSRRFTGPTPVRSAWRSGIFTEGWAEYAEYLMGACGYPGDPAAAAAVRVQRLKGRLRAIINAILDVRVHCLDMTEAEAMALMTGPGYQEDGEAAGKWRRALLTSAQLPTYYVGFAEVGELVAELRRAHPGWPLRQVHDEVLAHGSPPPRHLRTLLGLQPTGGP